MTKRTSAPDVDQGPEISEDDLTSILTQCAELREATVKLAQRIERLETATKEAS